MELFKNKILVFALCIQCVFLTVTCFAQGIGNGQDGSPSISGIVNSYTYLLNDAGRCENKLNVADASAFNSGDLILIMQMQGAIIDGTNTPTYGTIQDYRKSGNYEFAKVQSVSINEITLQYALTRYYAVSGKVQVIRVPQYQKPTVTGNLTCPPWDGQTGGVLVIDAQDTITMNNQINVMGKGFRGGLHHTAPCIFAIRYDYVAEWPDPQYYAAKGEGIAFYGIDPFMSGRGAAANGGGGGNIHTTGGGGGSNFGCGGDGGWGYPVDGSGGEKLVYGLGGYPLTYSNSANKLFLGGGGGAGHEHYGNGTSGANGGGIVIINCKAMDGNGNSILARGNNSASAGAYGDGAGGAGGGGCVLLSVQYYLSKLFADISGGTGGCTIAQGFGPGGGGGGGICWFNNSIAPDSVTVLSPGGLKGLAGGGVYGGSDGCNGGILVNLQVPFNNTYPSVFADFSLTPIYLTDYNVTFASNKVITFINLSLGGTSTYWNFGDSYSDTMHDPMHTYSALGAYTIQLIESNAMCSDTVSKNISTEFDIPNVFTPNKDNKNDFFPEINWNFESTVTIFNRWGQIVFKGENMNTNWDGTYMGKDVSSGTYFYIFNFMNNEGKTFIKEGTLTLLR